MSEGSATPSEAVGHDVNHAAQERAPKKPKMDEAPPPPPEAAAAVRKRPKTQLVLAAEEFVRKEMEGNDGSHDWWHIDRVRNTALELCEEEGYDDPEVVELGALLHDIKDWKYSGSDTAGVDAVRQFLSTHHYPKTDVVCSMVANVGFKNELKAADEQGGAPHATPLELGILQDADRLDAIGAIGIARTFTYGGARNRPLFDPSDPPRANLTKEQYMNTNHKASTVNHFYEKLLSLKDRMKTRAGQRRAEKRHAVMVAFLQQFFDEWSGAA